MGVLSKKEHHEGIDDLTKTFRALTNCAALIGGLLALMRLVMRQDLCQGRDRAHITEFSVSFRDPHIYKHVSHRIRRFPWLMSGIASVPLNAVA